MKKTIKVKQILQGKEQATQLVKNIVKGDTFFPKGIHLDDMDRCVKLAFENGFEIVSNGVKIPTISIFSIERYAEHMSLWQNTDNTNTVKLPFIALVRESTKKGTNLGGNYNVPSTPTFNLWRRPILKNGKTSVEYYQIPQPVNIDVGYKIHIFCRFIEELNRMDELVLHNFKEAQYYIQVNGHYMPLYLESMDDSSETSNIDKRRYYHKTYTMTLKGYLLREEDYKKLSSVDKITLAIETGKPNPNECVITTENADCDLCFNFKFTKKTGNSKTIKIPMDLELYYDNQNPSNDYDYFVNGSLVQLPFVVRRADELIVAHNIGNNVVNIKVCGRKL